MEVLMVRLSPQYQIRWANIFCQHAWETERILSTPSKLFSTLKSSSSAFELFLRIRGGGVGFSLSHLQQIIEISKCDILSLEALIEVIQSHECSNFCGYILNYLGSVIVSSVEVILALKKLPYLFIKILLHVFALFVQGMKLICVLGHKLCYSFILTF